MRRRRRRRPLPLWNDTQLSLFGAPEPEPAAQLDPGVRPATPCGPYPATVGPMFRGRSELSDGLYDAFLYPRDPEIGGSAGLVPKSQTCTWSEKEKEASRNAQHALWTSGWRPQTPPRPYRPEPQGHPARTYQEADANGKLKPVLRPDLDYDPDVRAYDKILVQFSGGKDSVACLLYMIELCCEAGIDPSERIEAWHQCVDGDPRPIRDQRGPNGEPLPVPKRYLFDWPCTEDYVVKVCSALNIPLLFQWRTGGIMGGVFQRAGDPPYTVGWEEPEPGQPLWSQRSDAAPPPGYRVRCISGKRPSPDLPAGKPRQNERLRWPTIGKINQGRWCSSYVKIEAFNRAFGNSPRFDGLRVLVVTGERAEESSNRATYKAREFDHKAGHGKVPRSKERKAAMKARGITGKAQERYVEGWKPVLDWCEIEVWAIMAKHGLRPHPAYELGYGRLSCAMCVFSSRNQLETIRSTSPQGARVFDQFVRAEQMVAKLQAEAKKYPERWNKDDYKKAIPTIKSRSEKQGRKKISVPVPLSDFVNEPEDASRAGPAYAESIARELRGAGVPEDVVSYHAQRALEGLPVAYPASVTQPELALAAWSEHLPPDWTPYDPRWRDPGYMPAGAFGEDAGPE